MISKRIRIREPGAVHCSECGNEKIFRVQVEEIDPNEYEYRVQCDACGHISEPVATETSFAPRMDRASLIGFILALSEEEK